MAEISERREVRVRGDDATFGFAAEPDAGRLVIREDRGQGDGEELCALTISDREELSGFLQGLRRVLGVEEGQQDATPIEQRPQQGRRASPGPRGDGGLPTGDPGPRASALAASPGAPPRAPAGLTPPRRRSARAGVSRAATRPTPHRPPNARYPPTLEETPIPRPALARAVDAMLEATTVGSYTRIGHAVRSRLERWDALHELDGADRRVVVTGATSGLGEATAAALLRTGARPHLLVRSPDRLEQLHERLRGRLAGELVDRITHDVADLADLSSVRAAAHRLTVDGAPVHALIHNAGATFDRLGHTDDGLERTYQLHVAAPLLLTALLRPSLQAAAPARVVTVSSGGMYTRRLDVEHLIDPGAGYAPLTAYAQAKRAQVELTAAWQRRADRGGVDAHVMHPGWAATPGVETSLPRFATGMRPLLRSPAEGADTIVWLALADLPDVEPPVIWHDRRARAVHRLPTTRAPRGEVDRLLRRVADDVGLDPAACWRHGSGT